MADTPDRGEGRVIGGRYRLLRKLGSGGMGRVWLAYDDELACEVSMKEIMLPDVPMDASEPAQRIARARSEARHAARLRGHPHVATVHDVLLHEGLPWIVMEYVADATDLQSRVRTAGPLPTHEAARVGRAVLDALTAGHRIGILHRDVKPANILLAPDTSGNPFGRVLLTDYGIALQPESREPRLTSTAGILGTPGYLAPERARGEPPTPAADLFSLGATLYYAVEGRGPFDRGDEYAMLTALVGEDPWPPARAGELWPVLQGLLNKDPVLRSAPDTAARRLLEVEQGTGGAPPGGVFGPPPVVGYHGGGTPAGYQGATPAGYQGATPAGYQGATPVGYQGSTPQTPGTPGAPGTPHTPGTPQTPGTPGGPQPPYGQQPLAAQGQQAWPGQQPHSPYDPWNSPDPGHNTPGPHQAQQHGGSPSYPTVSHTASGGAPGPRRKLPTPVVIALVIAVIVALAGLSWGAWATFGGTEDPDAGKKNSPTPTAPRSTPPPSPAGPVFPYGETVGLKKALQAGDCVNVVWSGTPFKSQANLGVVECGAEDALADGQVMALESHASAQEAEDQGAARCASQVGPTAEALPDAGVHAVVPTAEGFEAAGRATACLVVGEHAEIGGEIGRFRDDGQMLYTNQMAAGDCLLYDDSVKDSEGYRLTDCTQKHGLQVIPTATAPSSMNWDKANDDAWKICGNKYESTWAPGGERSVFGFAPYEEDWKEGARTLVCLVGRTDGTEFTGRIADPAET